eukprot:587955-Prymnesium_polylepis.1
MPRCRLLLLIASLACASGFSLHTSSAARPARPASSPHRCAAVRADGYSNRVKVTAESRAPLRQARIFFFYPAVIAGASVGAYVSFTRVLAGLTVRPELDPVADGINLAVNFGVVAAAVFFGRGDLKGKDALLKEIAIELGELKPDAEPAEEPTPAAADE